MLAEIRASTAATCKDVLQLKSTFIDMEIFSLRLEPVSGTVLYSDDTLITFGETLTSMVPRGFLYKDTTYIHC